MCVTKRKWCFAQPFALLIVLSLFITKIYSLTITDLGLPRKNFCLFSYNQSVYIIGGQTSTPNSFLKITFNSPLDTTPPTISSKAIDLFSNQPTQCSVTSSGKVMVVTTNNKKLNLIDIDSLNIIESVMEGVQRNDDMKDVALMSFNDEFIMLISNDAFILDTRSLNTALWSQVPVTSTADSAPSITSSFPIHYATSRWILHFGSGPPSTTPNSMSSPTSMHMIDIYIFDPVQLQWLGKVSQLLDSPSPSIGIMPQGDNKDVFVVYSTDNNQETRFWTLNVSSTTPSVEISNAWNTQISLQQSSVVVTNDNTVMIIHNDNDQLPVFFNAKTYTELPPPVWLNRKETSIVSSSDPTAAEEIENNHKRNELAIILGSVLGGGAFLVIACTLCLCFHKRRRAKNKTTNNEKVHGHFESHPYEFYNKNKERQMSTSSPISETTTSQILLAPKPIAIQEEEYSEKKPVFTSRFKEHFDIASLPDLKRTSTCSLHHTVSTHSTIPRSISSHM